MVKFPTALTIKLDLEMLSKLDEWRRKEQDLPSRAEAVRRMIDLATKTSSASPRVLERTT